VCVCVAVANVSKIANANCYIVRL